MKISQAWVTRVTREEEDEPSVLGRAVPQRFLWQRLGLHLHRCALDSGIPYGSSGRYAQGPRVKATRQMTAMEAAFHRFHQTVSDVKARNAGVLRQEIEAEIDEALAAMRARALRFRNR